MSNIQTLADFQKSYRYRPIRITVRFDDKARRDYDETIEQLRADGVPEEELPVAIPEEMSTLIRPLSSGQRDLYETSIAGIDGKRNLINYQARLVAQSLCDENGQLTHTTPNQIQAVADMPSLVVHGFFKKIQMINGMKGDEDVDKAGKGSEAAED